MSQKTGTLDDQFLSGKQEKGIWLFKVVQVIYLKSEIVILFQMTGDQRNCIHKAPGSCQRHCVLNFSSTITIQNNTNLTSDAPANNTKLVTP